MKTDTKEIVFKRVKKLKRGGNLARVMDGLPGDLQKATVYQALRRLKAQGRVTSERVGKVVTWRVVELEEKVA